MEGFLWVLQFVLLRAILSVEASAVAMGNRTDSMGQYTLLNSVQCQRLCWYRRLCVAYSYNDQLTAGANCVLHAAPLQAATLPSGWKIQSASNKGISSACATRVCTETEVCVRVTPPPANGHKCVPFPADCGSPAVTDGSLEWNGTTQGDVATLTCDNGYNLAPGSSSQLTCHVTSRWTPLQVTCIRSCQNGGYNDGQKCVCPLPYTGPSCERYFRDCKEAFDSGHQDNSQSQPMLIQPDPSSPAFNVYCTFQWGGVTYVMSRSTISPTTISFDKTWQTLKAGLMSDVLTNPNSLNYFIGLEQLHTILSQANYRLHLSLWGGNSQAVGNYYNNFDIGPESTNYEFRYSSHYPREDTAAGGNCFPSPGPWKFSTKTSHDANGCAQSKGMAGWFDPSCSGCSFFGTTILALDGNSQMIFRNLALILERQGDFHDSLFTT